MHAAEHLQEITISEAAIFLGAVAKISDNFVELKTADLTIVLKMDE